MQFIETNDLKPGMRLAKPIYSKTGVMLYDRDTKLSPKGIASIKNFNLIGLYILEPAEPLPPLSQEDLEFEQFQTVAMFQIQDIMEAFIQNHETKDLNRLAQNIIKKYGSLNHKINFTQPLRSANDYVYKHANSVAILTAIISHVMQIPYADQVCYVCAALMYDIGYLYVESNQLLAKGKQLTKYEEDMLQKCRKKGLDKLSEDQSRARLPEGAYEVIQQMVIYGNRTNRPKNSKVKWLTGTKILQVADAYDRMTAMSMETKPVSEIAAIRYLADQKDYYDSQAVSALIASIQLLPVGCCVDLSNKEKGLVIEDNPHNFMEPLVLKFSNNKIYDLSDPEVKKSLRIIDIMKTMDNRIKIDAETLEKFKADKYVSEMAEKYRRQKEQSAKSATKKATGKLKSSGAAATDSKVKNTNASSSEKNTESTDVANTEKKSSRKKLV